MIQIEDYRAQIEAALQHSEGTHTFEDVAQGLVEGRFQAWVNGGSIAVTEIITYPRKRALHCFLAGGKMAEIVEMMPAASDWGRMMGCSSFTVAGRKGWMRALRRYGWRPAFYVVQCDL